MQYVESKIAQLEETIRSNTESLRKLLAANDRKTQLMDTTEGDAIKKSYADTLKGTCDKIVKKVTEKIQSLNKEDPNGRELNIIIHNIPEGTLRNPVVRQRL